MSTVVIYQSSTGFTKQYAEWIAGGLACRAVSIKEVAAADLAEKDTVIFGGWIMGNAIMGYDKMKQMGAKRLVVFAVGASPDSKEAREKIVAANNLKETPFFYMPGGMQFDKLNFFVRFMLKQMKKSISKKSEKSEQDSNMERMIGTNFDASDKKYILELVGFMKEAGEKVNQ